MNILQIFDFKNTRLHLMSLASLLSITMSLSAADVSPEAQWDRFIGLQLEIAEKQANGLGEQHVTIVKLNEELEALREKIPDRKDRQYIGLLQSENARLDREDAILNSKGLGLKHPSRQSIVAQRSIILGQFEEFGKSYLILIGGSVKKTGYTDWEDGLTLQSAVEKAGGVTEFGTLARVAVWRVGAKTLYDLRNPEQAATKLLPGDVIDVDFKKCACGGKY